MIKILKVHSTVEIYKAKLEEGGTKDTMAIVDDIIVENNLIHIQSKPIKNVCMNGISSDDEVIFRFATFNKDNLIDFFGSAIIRGKYLNKDGEIFLADIYKNDGE